MANERITVTVMNWEKHNPRKDVKHPSWFALSNRFLEDPDFCDFAPSEFKAIIYIFCQASQKNAATVTLNTAHSKRVCDIDAHVLRKTIEKLAAIGCVQVESDPRTDSVRPRTDTSLDTTLQDKQDKTEQDTPPAEFAYGAVYEKYPRKEGKDAGMRSIRDQVGNNPETFADFEKAVDHYAALVKKRNTEPKFIKQWSSFVGTKRSAFPWREFIQRPAELDAIESAPGEVDLERLVREEEAYRRERMRVAGVVE